jgi:putative ABC transport system permease protein
VIALRHALFLAARSLSHHRIRSSLIVIAVAISVGLPLAIRSLIHQSTDAMMARGRSTPLVVGARGSELDLVVAALYATTAPPRPLPVAEFERVKSMTAGLAVPMHVGFTARKQPIIGTTLDYFLRRGLVPEHGRLLATIGECVVGAKASAALNVTAGDPLVTDASDPYNLAGTIPLKLHVVGTLAPTGTADDDAIFVDVKTAWIIAGIGHGHQEASTIRDPNDLVGSVDGHVVTSERLRHVEEITPESIASFHFHGDPGTFPIHAILLWPADEKEGTLLRGAFQRRDEPLQVVRPSEVMERLVREILRVRRMLDGLFAVIALATTAIVGLVVGLAVRLRREELTTMVRLGAARGTVAWIIGTEVFLLALLAAGLVGLTLVASLPLRPLVERLLVG